MASDTSARIEIAIASASRGVRRPAYSGWLVATSAKRPGSVAITPSKVNRLGYGAGTGAGVGVSIVDFSTNAFPAEVLTNVANASGSFRAPS